MGPRQRGRQAGRRSRAALFQPTGAPLHLARPRKDRRGDDVDQPALRAARYTTRSANVQSASSSSKRRRQTRSRSSRRHRPSRRRRGLVCIDPTEVGRLGSPPRADGRCPPSTPRGRSRRACATGASPPTRCSTSSPPARPACPRPRGSTTSASSRRSSSPSCSGCAPPTGSIAACPCATRPPSAASPSAGGSACRSSSRASSRRAPSGGSAARTARRSSSTSASCAATSCTRRRRRTTATTRCASRLATAAARGVAALRRALRDRAGRGGVRVDGGQRQPRQHRRQGGRRRLHLAAPRAHVPGASA